MFYVNFIVSLGQAKVGSQLHGISAGAVQLPIKDLRFDLGIEILLLINYPEEKLRGIFSVIPACPISFCSKEGFPTSENDNIIIITVNHDASPRRFFWIKIVFGHTSAS